MCVYICACACVCVSVGMCGFPSSFFLAFYCFLVLVLFTLLYEPSSIYLAATSATTVNCIGRTKEENRKKKADKNKTQKRRM